MDDDFGLEDVDAYMNARGTSGERLARAVDSFSKIAQAGDEAAARTILAQLENLDPNDPAARNGLDANRVAIVQTAVAGIRRGTATDFILTAISSVTGLVLGYYVQKNADGRVMGVPAWAPLGAVGAGGTAMSGGKVVDLHSTWRHMMMTGGACFSAGATIYALENPETPTPDTLEGVIIGSE